MKSPRRYTDEERQFLKEYIPGHHHAEIADAFNARFEPHIDREQVRTYIKNNKIYTGFSGRFMPGAKPNAGAIKKGEHKSRATEFKKGQEPPNKKPVGTIVLRKNHRGRHRDEYYIKEGYKLWVPLRQHVWEEHYGKPPEGYIVTHRNGDQLDCRIENLRLIPKGALPTIAHHNDTRGEAREAVISIGVIKSEIRRIKNGTAQNIPTEGNPSSM